MEDYRTLTPRFALCLANPRTWVASVYPAIFGELYCMWVGLPFSPGMAVVLLCICILMQSGVNTINDFFDYIKGTDTQADCLERDDAVLIYEHIDPRQVLALGGCFLGAAALLGVWVVRSAGYAPLLVGIVGGLAVVGYSAGPCPLSYLPVGELVSGVVMGGLIPLGVTAAISRSLCWEVLLYALPFIFGIGLLMMTNNLSDIEKDIEAGRRTLPVLLGRQYARRLYHIIAALWLAAATVLPCLLFGPKGLTAVALLLIFGRQSFGFLFCAPMTQTMRIEQIRNIVEANLIGNGAYLLSIVVALLF